MPDPRVERFARLLVRYCAGIERGDRVFVEAELPAEPLVHALFKEILGAGGYPELLVSLDGFSTYTGLDATFLTSADSEQLAKPPSLLSYAYETFESRIRIHASRNFRHLANQDPAAIRRRRGALGPILAQQFARGGSGALKWVTTVFPTEAYAQEAGMSLSEYKDFVFEACHVADKSDPIEYWQGVGRSQKEVVEALADVDRIHLQGPNCDLRLSVAGREFFNSCGRHNMPDGEVYTSPVEDSANGWVQFTYPANYQGRSVVGARLVFESGRVVEATAESGEDFMRAILETDAGSRYLGEFAIGTNFAVDRYTGLILLDEKIGGSFHLALGAGYPETGSQNQSAIHWDLICDVREDSRITVDSELLYENGEFRL